MVSSSIWLQSAVAALTAEGYDPNRVIINISGYIAGQNYDEHMVTRAIQLIGPLWNQHDAANNYQKWRGLYITTGDLTAFLHMIDSVTLDA